MLDRVVFIDSTWQQCHKIITVSANPIKMTNGDSAHIQFCGLYIGLLHKFLSYIKWLLLFQDKKLDGLQRVKLESAITHFWRYIINPHYNHVCLLDCEITGRNIKHFTRDAMLVNSHLVCLPANWGS